MNVSTHPAAVERAMSAAQQLLASLGDDADEVLRRDLLEGETDALEIVRQLIRSALDAESLTAAANERIGDLCVRRDRFKKRAESARETVKKMLEVLEVPALSDPEFTVSTHMGPPKPIVTDPELLEDEFVRVSRSPNLTAIGKAQTEGRTVRGAARSNGSIVLTIRTK